MGLSAQDSTSRVSEVFLKMVVNIEIPLPGKVETGTGFIISKNYSSNESRIFLVTNKHMIGDYNGVDQYSIYDSVRVKFYSSDHNTNIPVILHLKDKNGQVLPTVKTHDNPIVDVAVLDITQVFLDHPNISTDRLDIVSSP